MCDLDLAMKKPYETLILGRVSHSEASTSKIAVPEARVIASVPSSIHSQKPPLHGKAWLNGSGLSQQHGHRSIQQSCLRIFRNDK